MSALSINGIAIPVAVDGWSEDPVVVGEMGRSASGKALSTVRRRYYKRSGSALFTVNETAEAVRELINGSALGWSFDSNLFSDGTGLGPTTGYTSSVVASDGGATPKFGAKFLKCPIGDTTMWTHGLGCSGWSMSVWTWESAAWHHYWARSDTAASAHYKDGVAVGSAKPAWMAGSSTTVTLKGDAGAVRYFDDLHFFPYLAPVEWPLAIYYYGAAWPKAPLLTVAGDLISHGSATMRGLAGKTAVTNRGASQHMQRVDFSLEED